MNYFKVLIFENEDHSFTTSYRHPLSKKRIRMNFLNQNNASKYKESIEKKFKKSKFRHYGDATIKDLLLYFMQEVPNSPFHSVKIHLLDFIETFGKYTTEEITSKALKSWMDQVQKENNLKAISTRGLKCQIDTFFNFLKQREIISQSPLAGIYYEVQDIPLNSRNLLSSRDIEKLLRVLKDYSPGFLYPIVKMYSETAAKSNEIIELAWEQLSFDNKTVKFKRKKRSHERIIKISDELVTLLQFKTRQGERVFVNYDKTPLTYDKLRANFNEFKRKKLYRKDWSPADLRHSFAVNFLLSGGNIRELQKILGHGNIFETKKLYGDVLAKTDSKKPKLTTPFKNGVHL